jgi:hypothetical protein
MRLGKTTAVTHQAARRSKLGILVDRWHRMADRQRGKLRCPSIEERIGADQQAASFQRAQRIKNRRNITVCVGLQDMDLQPEEAGRCLYLFR